MYTLQSMQFSCNKEGGARSWNSHTGRVWRISGSREDPDDDVLGGFDVCLSREKIVKLDLGCAGVGDGKHSMMFRSEKDRQSRYLCPFVPIQVGCSGYAGMVVVDEIGVDNILSCRVGVHGFEHHSNSPAVEALAVAEKRVRTGNETVP